MIKQQAKLPQIKKEAFKSARESLGLSVKEVSSRACLSVRQIEQIESGETSSFYGPQIKVTAAKKVAGILQLKDEDAFDFGDALPITVSDSQSVVEEVKASKPIVAESFDNPLQPQVVNTSKKTADPKEILSPNRVANSDLTSRKLNKKPFIFLGIAAALVFSFVNLRPLFFPEPIKEEVVVVEEIAPPVTSSGAPEDGKVAPAAATPEPVAATTASPVSSTVCPASDSVAVSYKPDAAKKTGDMVYLQSKTEQTVCVVDASGVIQNKTLAPGVGTSVYGKPPLKVLTSGESQVDMYYQGMKVRLSNVTAKNILLEPAEIIQPSTPVDAQVR